MVCALDLETCCDVPSCKHYGKAMCAEGHSLSPWHSRITVAALLSPTSRRTFRGEAQLQELGRILQTCLFELTMHGGKFDALHLIQKNIIDMDTLFAIWEHDTHLASFVWTNKIPDQWLAEYAASAPSSSRKAGKHSLKTLAPYFLGVEPHWEVEDKDDDAYVLKDVEYSYKLNAYLQEHMDSDAKQFYRQKLLPWAKMLVQAELRGLKLDVEGLLQFQTELEGRERKLEAELDHLWSEAHVAYNKIMVNEVHKKYNVMKETKAREPRREVALSRVPDKVSYDSPAQMKWLLGDFYGYDLRSLEGTEGTGKEVLNRLADEGRDDVKVYLEWRKTQKLLTAFIPSLLELCDGDGVIHPIYNPCGARTGRTSSERPNAQQVPSSLKKFFKPREGKLVGYDQSAIEAKLIAAYTEDQPLMQTIQTGESIHNVNTVTFFGLDCKPSEVPELYPKHRKAAKNIGFALFYFAGANRIRIAFTQAGFPITQNEARRIHKNFLTKHETAINFAKGLVASFEEGEVVNNLLGRPIRIEHAEDAYMQGFNTLVQSSASDINLDRMHAALETLKQLGIKAYPVLTVHDYAGIEVVGDDATVEKANASIAGALTDFYLQTSFGKVNLEVEGGISNEWN